MKRHELDLFSLLSGLLFLAIASVYVVAEILDRDVSTQWILPLGLIGLGVAGLAGGVARAVRSNGTNGTKDANGANVSSTADTAPDEESPTVITEQPNAE